MSGALVLFALLVSATPAQAAYPWYTVRLARTYPAALWVGLGQPSPFLGTAIVLWRPIGSEGTETWALGPDERPGAYRFINVSSNKCMDIQGPSADNGTKVHQWDCHGGASQAWRLVRGPVGRQIGHQIINVYANKCLDVTGFQNQRGTRLQIWSCSLAWNQDFVVTRVAG